MPTVVATPCQDPTYTPSKLNDTFAVTLTSVSATGFTANIIRTDAPQQSWAQNLQLNWVAISDDY